MPATYRQTATAYKKNLRPNNQTNHLFSTDFGVIWREFDVLSSEADALSIKSDPLSFEFGAFCPDLGVKYRVIDHFCSGFELQSFEIRSNSRVFEAKSTDFGENRRVIEAKTLV